MKLPWSKWFWADWLKDPELGKCSPPTRAVWMDLLCAMGVGNTGGTITGTAEELARVARCQPADVVSAAAELKRHNAADVSVTEFTDDNNVKQLCYAFTSRRLTRETKARKSNYQRQVRYRHRHCNGEGNAFDNAANDAALMPQKTEVRSQNNNNTGLPDSAEQPKDGRVPDGVDVVVVALLKGQGVSDDVSIALAKLVDEKRVRQVIEYAKRMEQAKQIKGASVAGYIVAAIRESWNLPEPEWRKTFSASSAAEKRKASEAEATAAREVVKHEADSVAEQERVAMAGVASMSDQTLEQIKRELVEGNSYLAKKFADANPREDLKLARLVYAQWRKGAANAC